MPDRGNEERGRLEFDIDRSSLHRFGHEAMATVFEVFVYHEDHKYCSQAAHAAFCLVDGLEGHLSRFIENSDVSQINTLEAGRSLMVDVSTWRCLNDAKELYRLTGGVFDICFRSKRGGRPIKEFFSSPDDIILNDEISVSVRRGVDVDLGGIGKGFAVDAIAEEFNEWGLECFLIHGGKSSVRAGEAPEGARGWPVNIFMPARAQPLKRVYARNVCLGASGVEKGEHIFSPVSGKGVVGGKCAWSVAPCASMADGLSTAFMIMDSADIEKLCEAREGFGGFIAEHDRQGGVQAVSYGDWRF